MDTDCITSIISEQTPELPTEAEMHAVADYVEEQTGRKPYRHEWAQVLHPNVPESACAIDRDARQVRDLITKSGMSYRELAAATGYSRSLWNHLAKGIRRVQERHLVVLESVVN